MTILVLSCSLNPGSNSNVLAVSVGDELRKLGVTVEAVDLREHPMPLCDGESCDNASIAQLKQHIAAADAILMAVPVYNYDVNAAAKNLVEHTGKAWEGKIVGFLAAAGGQASYMSVMSLANSLMLDFRCLIVPRFVYAVYSDFEGATVSSEKVRSRVTQLAGETVRLAKALTAISDG